MKSTKIMGVRVDGGSLGEVARMLSERWVHEGLTMVFTPNVEQVMLADKDPEYKDVLNSGDINVCDGVGLVWADRWLRRREGKELVLKERVTGVDLGERLMREAAKRGINVFLIGGGKGVAKRAEKELTARIESLRIKGASGPRDASRESRTDEREWKEEVEKWQPGLILVAFGAPKQERWLMKHKEWLQANGVRTGMVVGGAVDVWAGEVARAPLKWQKNGLEWLWRLIHEPWRWKRQIALMKFGWRVIWGLG